MALTPFLENMYADQIRAKIPEADILKDAAKQAATEEKTLDQVRRQYADLSNALKVAPQTLSPQERAWLDRAPELIKQTEARVNMWRGGGVNVQDLSGTGGAITAASLATEIKPITIQQNGKDVTMYTVGGKVYSDMPSAQAASQAAIAQAKTTTGGVTSGGVAGVPGAAAAPQGFNLQAGLDILNKSGLDAGTKALFEDALKNWNPNSEINVQNVVKTFEKIKNETIDPYFAEQAKIFTDQIKSTEAYTRAARAGELEGEQMQSEAAVKGTQEDLESRGLTFSGKAVEQLGQKSALGAQGTPSTTWQMGVTPEGKVNQANRLMATSSQARFQKALEGLSRQAETTLGSGGSAGMVAGVQQLGGISGELPRAKTAQYANVASDLFGQEQQNYQQNKNINLFK